MGLKLITKLYASYTKRSNNLVIKERGIYDQKELLLEEIFLSEETFVTVCAADDGDLLVAVR